MEDQAKDKKQQGGAMSRGHFLTTTAAAAAVFTIVPRHVLGGPGYQAPSDTLNIAGVGIGGQGSGNIGVSARTENIYALCDVDMVRAARTFSTYPRAKKYIDFRNMLDKEPSIDAVVVATHDSNHAPVAMAAMRAGKHAFVQKPLTNTIHEARMLKEAAKKYGVITQMGNQGHAGDGIRLIKEWVADGAIGPVREAWCWTNRPTSWAQGIDRPKETPPVPRTLDWDLWLGPAPFRPYNPAYLPRIWRGWWDFGSAALGDMGCHIMDSAVWPLNLGHPTSAEAVSTPVNNETGPLASIITINFPARGDMPPIKLTWSDGNLRPPQPPELEEGRRMGNSDGGTLLVGDKGKIMCGCYSSEPRLIPEKAMQEYERPEPTIPRVPGGTSGIIPEWIEGCKTGKQPCSNFEVSGTLTEIVLMGNLAIRSGKRIEWDGPNMKVTNNPDAQKYVGREYRKGWTL